jgi:uncharacterized protein YegL
MGILETTSVPRRTMVLFFIVDSSGSMTGSKIGALNQAIREVLPMLDDISASNADAEIKIAVLDFSSGCRWMFDEPKPASEFKSIWQDREASGLTDLGEACRELSRKLSRDAFMKADTGAFAPVLLLLTDGEPTDDFPGGLKKLKENRWYKAAIKVAIAIGNDANKELIKEFTGNMEAVIEVHNIDALKKLIRTVSVTASQIGSQSTTAGSKNKQEQVVEQLKKVVEETDGAYSTEKPANDPDDEWD